MTMARRAVAQSMSHRLGLLACVFGALAACSPHGAPPAPSAPPVSVTKAVTKDVPVTVATVGTVEPIDSVAVKSLVDGQLLEVLVHDGADVIENQLLFRIDPRPAEAALRQAEANQAKDQAALDQARTEVKRNAPVAAKGYISADQMQQLQTAVEAAVASVAVDQANVAAAKLTRAYTEIRSPLAGRVGRILVQAGNLVKANDTNALLVINRIEPIYVNFALPGAVLSRVLTAQTQGPLAVGAQPVGSTGSIEGQVAFVDNAVDSSTGTIHLRAKFANDGHELWPGQLVGVNITLGHDASAVVVPDHVVQTGPKGTYVFVVDAQSRASQRAVTIARSAGGESVVASGLAAGETVVVDGQSRIEDGVAVKPTPAGP